MRSFHDGELEVQRRAGVSLQASSTAGVMRDHIPNAAMEFLKQRPFVVLAGVHANGPVWPSLLFGRPGFLNATDEHTLQLHAAALTRDQERGEMIDGSPAGFLAIDFATRRRAKFKGVVKKRDRNSVLFRIKRCYALCPKYIQAREVPAEAGTTQPSRSTDGSKLTDSQREQILHSDTFFIATYHPEIGADASHRGGFPGFVQVLESDLLMFPDYAGNNMFNTLGNLTANPNVGLLFPDFESGSVLQLSGKGEVVYDEHLVNRLPGAERVVRIRIAKTKEVSHAIPPAWRFLNYSPFNPDAT